MILEILVSIRCLMTATVFFSVCQWERLNLCYLGRNLNVANGQSAIWFRVSQLTTRPIATNITNVGRESRLNSRPCSPCDSGICFHTWFDAEIRVSPSRYCRIGRVNRKERSQPSGLSAGFFSRPQAFIFPIQHFHNSIHTVVHLVGYTKLNG